jgi:hypothetical protein
MAMQLHSEWAYQRPAFTGLLLGYARSACKPTVAFPYVALLFLAAAYRLLQQSKFMLITEAHVEEIFAKFIFSAQF